MQKQERHILLLARPGYRRNGIEASLRTIEDTILDIADDCESGHQIIQQRNPDLFLIYPNGLETSHVCAICNRFKDQNKHQVILLSVLYGEELSANCCNDCQMVNIESSMQLIQLVKGRFSMRAEE